MITSRPETVTNKLCLIPLTHNQETCTRNTIRNMCNYLSSYFDTIARIGHHLPFVKFLGSPVNMSVWKSWFWEGQNCAPIFHHLWTKVHQIRNTCTGVIAVCNVVFCDQRYLVPIQRYLRLSCEVVQNLAKMLAFGPPNFLGGRGPKFLTYI